ncbi:MAG: permease, partial [Bdellovibrionales bacterium]|nr:permease [Bdellovibrionales bacterium]
MDTNLVLASIAILIGPLLYQLLSLLPGALRAIDGFVFVSIGGLLLGHLAHELGTDQGWQVILSLVLGFFGPLFLERQFQSIRRSVHFLTLVAGAIGFFFHSMFDGVALVSHLQHSTHNGAVQSADGAWLALAIIIHRIPVGLTLWWLLRPRFGLIVTYLSLGITIGGTVLGYLLSQSYFVGSLEHTFAWVQAFVAGSILHVVFFRFHLHCSGEEHRQHVGHSHEGEGSCCHEETTVPKQAKVPFLSSVISSEGIGNLLGFGLLALFFFTDTFGGGHHSDGHSVSVFHTFVILLFQSAPALFLAYLLGVFLYGFFPEGTVHWLKRGNRVVQATKGMVFGLPLPLCSCGVLPYFQTLVKRGAPPAAAIAFLVATPELGIDAFLISFPLLGGELTIVRLIACACIAFAVSIIVTYGTSSRRSLPVVQQRENESFQTRLLNGVRFSFFELVDTTAPWMITGLVLGAIFGVLLGEMGWNVSPWIEVPLFSCIGLVTYVCASGGTPLVAALIAGGVS